MVYNFCTLFDSRYLNKGLLMIKSLRQQCDSAKIFVLCLDDVAFEVVSNYGDDLVRAVSLTELEAADQALASVKRQRSLVEYYFTMSPCWPAYLLRRYPEMPFITSLDADLYFFRSPAPVFSLLQSASVLITPHAFPPRLKHLEVNGLYNVSFQVFKNNDIGLAVLADWREKCLDWCADIVESNRFADQKYLDYWQNDFGEIKEIDLAGIMSAPWNIDDKPVYGSDVGPFVNDQPIICHHYHSLRFLGPRLVSLGLAGYQQDPNKAAVKQLYLPYVLELAKLKENQKALAQQGNRGGGLTAWRMFFTKDDVYLLIAGRLLYLGFLARLALIFKRLWRKLFS